MTTPVAYPDQPEDSQLIQRCREGDAAAWSILVRRYQRLIYTVARRGGLSEESAADVFQDTFAALARHIERIDDGARVRAWLVTTAKRHTLARLDEQRRAAGWQVDDADAAHAVPDPDPLPEQQLAQWQELDRLRQALEQIEPRPRQLLELLFLVDPTPSYTDIANRLKIAEGSIGPLRARALLQLRRRLESL